MTKTFAGCCSALLVIGLPIFPGGLGSARAATTGHEEITVDGPFVVREQTTKRGLSGEMAEKTLTVSQNVSYADLDLSKPADVEKLRGRVNTAAVDSCKELVRRFPSSIYIPVGDDRRCAKDAAGRAMARVDAIASQSVARVNTGASQTLARAETPTFPPK